MRDSGDGLLALIYFWIIIACLGVLYTKIEDNKKCGTDEVMSALYKIKRQIEAIRDDIRMVCPDEEEEK